MEPLHYLLMKTQSQLHRQIMAQAADLGLSSGRRTQKDGNRRALYVSLTDRGRQTALQVQQIFQQCDARAVSGLSTEESLLLNQLLQRVYDAISQPERKSF